MRAIPGWLSRDAARLIVAVSDSQRDAGAAGGVGEIGVHFGRLFTLLLLLSSPDERAFACDIFDDQHLNFDSSGYGTEERFVGFVRKYSPKPFELFRQSSLDLGPETVLDAVGPVRLLSIDGGHTSQITASDLRLGEAVLSADGVVILDDVFNEAWPGVVSGLVEYRSSGALEPFASGGGKVFLARPPAASVLREALVARCATAYARSEALLGCDVALFPSMSGLSLREQAVGRLARTRFYRSVRDASVVRKAKRPVQRALRLR